MDQWQSSIAAGTSKRATSSTCIEPGRLIVQRHSPGSPWTYAELDRLQRKIAEEILREGKQGRVILSELAPVITLGRRADRQREIYVSDQELGRRGIEVYPTDRGGLATHHGPGQWVLFPIFRLLDWVGDSRGVRKAVRRLLEIGAKCAQGFGARAEIRGGPELGVWCRGKKLASVGIHVSRGVLLHGLSLNVWPTPESFYGVRPCGLGAEVAFLGIEAGVCAEKEAFFLEVGQRLVELSSSIDGSWGKR